MQKTLIALALLAAAGAASAQSTVTVYGKIDLGLVIDSGAAAGKSVRLSSGVTGGSRLGFKGTEDLGDGYKAGFVLETGYCADSAQTARGSDHIYCPEIIGRRLRRIHGAPADWNTAIAIGRPMLML